MKKTIGIILIALGLTISGLSIREYIGKNKKIEIFNYELFTVNKESKNIFYRNTCIGIIMLIGGITLTVNKKKSKS